MDCISWGNGDHLCVCSATHCCIEDGYAGEGSIHDDPMFITGPFGPVCPRPSEPLPRRREQVGQEAGLWNMTTQTDGMADTGILDMRYHHPSP